MELTKGFLLLFSCGLLIVLEARPHQKKQKVKHWWDEDWEPYFGKAGAKSQLADNLVADKKQNLNSKSKAAGTEPPKDPISKVPVEDVKTEHKDPVKPVLKPQSFLYNPTEESRWNNKHSKENDNKFVEDEDDYEKDYDDIEDEQDEKAEKADELDDDIDDEYDDYSEYSDEDSEENAKSDEASKQSSDEDLGKKDSKVEKNGEESQGAKDKQVFVEEKDYKEIEDMNPKKDVGENTVNAKIVDENKNDLQEKDEEKEDSGNTEVPINAQGDEDAHSVKKDLWDFTYLKELAKTKADLKTSPNPPPPGLVDGKITMVTPSGKKSLLKQEEPEFIQSKPFATCKSNADCRVGRMCHEEVCVCLGPEGCQGHYKPVCGIDRWSSNWYPSHCELHRTACVRGEHIKIDHSKSCQRKKEQLEADQRLTDESQADAIIDKTEIDIDNDVPQDAIKTPIINSGEIYDYPRKDPHPKKNKAGSQSASDPQVKKLTVIKKECKREEYEKFKQKLLEFHCRKFNEKNCLTDVRGEREYLATLMFSFYDRDLDFYLEVLEAQEMEQKEHFETLSDACVLSDLIVYADNNPKDGKLSVTEFIAAFNGSEKAVQPHQTIEVIPTLATVGNGLELKCGLADAEKIIWRRYNADIHELNIDDLTVFEDGSLFFSKVGVHHMGNYSCEDKKVPNVLQVHALRVQMAPIVHITPTSVSTVSGANVYLKCHAEGLPKPKILWTVNDMPIPNIPNHYVKSHENGSLSVYRSDYERDSGEYTCVASNSAGVAKDVTVMEVKPRGKGHAAPHRDVSGSFLVFHKKGYTVYESGTCLLEREVGLEFGNFKFIPDNLNFPLSLCQSETECQWGSAVEVKKFVYVSQPSLNRVIIVETAAKWNPIQVIDTDKVPRELHYLEHLDQVWVLCWNSVKDSSVKTVVVIRDASQYIQHHAVHMQPVGNKLDMVRDLFLPPNNDLHHAFKYGYVTHSQQQELSKINLKTMKNVKTIDFSSHNCVPKSVAYVPIGGHVIIECISETSGETIQLIMDYITDTVVAKKSLTGTPYVSPDSRHIVTVNKSYGKISVLRVSSTGLLENEFELTLSSSIDDVAFFPSPVHFGYEVVFTSADDDDIFFLNLANGKLDKVKGSTLVDAEWKPQPQKKTLVAGGVFSEYLLSSLPTSIRIINGKNHQIRCTFDGPVSSQAIAFVFK